MDTPWLELAELVSNMWQGQGGYIICWVNSTIWENMHHSDLQPLEPELDSWQQSVEPAVAAVDLFWPSPVDVTKWKLKFVTFTILSTWTTHTLIRNLRELSSYFKIWTPRPEFCLKMSFKRSKRNAHGLFFFNTWKFWLFSIELNQGNRADLTENIHSLETSIISSNGFLFTFKARKHKWYDLAWFIYEMWEIHTILKIFRGAKEEVPSCHAQRFLLNAEVK